jgi:ribulose bisphosphate carboxylase small subunit
VQAQYAVEKGWAASGEYTDDPHPRNTYWEMRGHPMSDNPNAAAVVFEVNECRREHGGKYIRVIAFDVSPGWDAIRMSFIVNRPATEPASAWSARKPRSASSATPSKAMPPADPKARATHDLSGRPPSAARIFVKDVPMDDARPTHVYLVQSFGKNGGRTCRANWMTG